MPKFVWKETHIGGLTYGVDGIGSLDSVDTTGWTDVAKAIVATSTEFWYYHFDPVDTSTEDAVNYTVIQPDTGVGRWLLIARSAKLEGQIKAILALTATAANTFTNGKVGFLSSAGTVTLADADTEATAKNMLLIATEGISGGASGNFATYGLVTVPTHGYTLGSPLFISETAGELTTTAPVGTGKIVRIVGYAVDANTLYIQANSTYIEL